jgi:hypothetical protein
VAWRDASGNSPAAPVVATGYKLQGAFVSPVTESQTTAGGPITFDTNVDIGRPQYDIGGVYDTNSEKYLARYFRFQEQNNGAGVSNYQLQINSANYPAYKLTIPEVYSLSLNSIDVYDKTRKISLDQYRKDYCVQCYRFCLPESDYSRMSSGLDTRATSAQCALVTENVTTAVACFMFAECSSELRVANRSIELIN